MATLHKGIITTRGLNLFNQVQAGNSQISYTKVVFCDDKDLLSMEDQDIRDLDDVHADNELKTDPEAYDNGLVTGKGGVQATEVDVRAVADNQNVKTGFYPYVSALYASDGKQEVLYGLVLDDKPGYLPQFDGFTPQPLIFNWRLFTATTDDFNLDDDHDVYATIADLKGIESKYKEFADQGTAELDNYKTSLTSSMNVAYSDVASQVSSLSTATSQLNTTIGPSTQSNITSLAHTMTSLQSNTANMTGSLMNSRFTSASSATTAVFNQTENDITNKFNEVNHKISPVLLQNQKFDFNNITKTGNYCISFNCNMQNAPFGASGSLFLIVRNDTLNDITQIVYDNSGKEFNRYCNFGNQWHAWHTLAHFDTQPDAQSAQHMSQVFPDTIILYPD